MEEKTKILLSALNNRYATKVFDPDKKIPKEKVDALLESIPLTPSSINAQPWHIFVVSNQKMKENLAQAAWGINQTKYINADYLFIFCAKKDYTLLDYIHLEELVARVRGVELDQKRIEGIGPYVEGMQGEEKEHWLKKQCYIMLGQFLTSCALLELDACPIEGFLSDKMDKLLGLPGKGLTSVVSVAVGYRDKNDFNQLHKAPKIRYPAEEILTILD